MLRPAQPGGLAVRGRAPARRWLEDSVFFSATDGARRTEQIVLSCVKPARRRRVRWRFERLTRSRREHAPRRSEPAECSSAASVAVGAGSVPVRGLIRAIAPLPACSERPHAERSQARHAAPSCPCPTRPASSDFARGARRARHRARLDRRHRARRSPRPACRCSDVSDLTGFPEMMDGRVKTLHPARAWRAPRRPGQSGAPGRDAGARDRADRPPRRQSLPVRGDGGRRQAPTTTASRTSTSAARR